MKVGYYVKFNTENKHAAELTGYDPNKWYEIKGLDKDKFVPLILLEGGNLFYEDRFEVAPSLPATGMVDEFGFPEPKKAQVSMEDLTLIKGFLGNLKDKTLSRGVFRVLEDLLGRLP